jgi:hypothetical protein
MKARLAYVVGSGDWSRPSSEWEVSTVWSTPVHLRAAGGADVLSERDYTIELTEAGAAELAGLLAQPPRRIPKLAAAFARRK